MGADVGLVAATIQIDAYAETYAAARSLAEAIRSALQRFSGTVASVEIQSVFMGSGPLDFYEEPVEAYRVSQDYLFWHREA